MQNCYINAHTPHLFIKYLYMCAFYCKDTNTEWHTCKALVDMCAFFPSCEQIDFPELRNQPIAVTNGANGTTIISSSYEARRYGVKTGMKLSLAQQLCPNIIQRPSRPDRYAEISSMIMNAITDIVPDIEIYSIDECFLDLVPVLTYYKSVTKIATLLRDRVYQVSNGIICSIGISEGKLTAKYCASTAKGQTTIVPADKIEAFMSNAPIEKICGIGKSLTEYLHQNGIFLCKDLKNAPHDILAEKMGDIGARLHSACLGHDPEPLNQFTEKPKSMRHSKILPPATTNFNVIQGVLHQLASRLARRLRAQSMIVSSIWIGLKINTGWIEASYTLFPPTNNTRSFFTLVNQHLTNWHGQPLFQVSIQCKFLLETQPIQADLFLTAPHCDNPIDTLHDKINRRFGKHTLIRASELQAKSINMVPVIAFQFNATSKSKNSL